jgi:hypothetical protein
MRHEYLSVYNLESHRVNADEIVLGGAGYLSNVVDFSAAKNTSGSHSVFTISGDVRIRLLPICEGDLVGHGASSKITLGFNGATTGLIGNTTASVVDKGEIWISGASATVTTYKATSSALLDLIVSGKTAIKLTVNSVSLSSGKINFHLWWEPISEGATVAAA